MSDSDMSLLEIKADLLKTAMQEDRNEIRIIREKIFNTISSILISSFAVTSFFIGANNSALKQGISFLMPFADVAFLLLLLGFFRQLKIDLKNARKCLELREELIQNLPLNKADDFKIFLTPAQGDPKIRDDELNSFVALACLVIFVKLIVILMLYR